jgi:hypothetical protein
MYAWPEVPFGALLALVELLLSGASTISVA